MIESFTGLPGSGKSLHCVRRLIKAASEGRKAYANFHSRFGLWDYVTWSDIGYVEEGLVVLDEAHMLFSARNWSATTQDQLALFQQHRKLGIDVIRVAQSASRVDVALRELTAFETRHKRVGKTCLWRMVDPAVPESAKEKTIKRGFFMISELLTRHYYTEERIGGKTGAGAGFGRWPSVDGRLPITHVRAGVAGRVWFGPVSEFTYHPAYEFVEGYYLDSYGRITQVDEFGGTPAELESLLVRAQSLHDLFLNPSKKAEGSKKGHVGRPPSR